MSQTIKTAMQVLVAAIIMLALFSATMIAKDRTHTPSISSGTYLESISNEYYIYDDTTGICYIAIPINSDHTRLEPVPCNGLVMKIQFEVL